MSEAFDSRDSKDYEESIKVILPTLNKGKAMYPEFTSQTLRLSLVDEVILELVLYFF
jgi:hypothetical protein